MGYAKMLKELFQGVTLNVEYLLHLEFFQIACLPGRVPRRKFSTLLREYPIIKRFIDTIPLPENSIDFLFTSNAIGWNLEK